MYRLVILSVLCWGLCMGGCASDLTAQENPFLTLSETFGITSQDQSSTTSSDSGSSGTAAEIAFRQEISLTLQNNHSTADLDTTLVAWVEVASVRSTEQADALYRGGYEQLQQEVSIGSAYVLPVGTFVYGGPGVAGATAVQLGSTSSGSLSSTLDLQMLTPDVLLVFSQPPTSCESVAFTFMRDGEALTAEPVADSVAPFGGATTSGGYKTLAQVDVYECSPLEPGLFLRIGGLTDADNEFLEGAAILFEFNEASTDDGNFAVVTISNTGEAIEAAQEAEEEPDGG